MNRFPDALRIEITQDDIDKARHGYNSTTCPVARAVNRIYPGMTASVTASTGLRLFEKIDTDTPHTEYFETVYSSNEALRSFVSDFDRHEWATPQVIWVERDTTRLAETI